jgi:Fe-Mn family superoxide dismutase
MADIESYKPRTFDLSGLNGISDQTLEIHFKLYEGYVTNTNKLNEKIAELTPEGKPADPIVFAELVRRLGFEYNGMVLHEYYFENMMKQGGGDPAGNSAFKAAAEKSFGSYERWKAQFAAVGTMRGVGWAICYQDTSNGRLSNHWINLHEDGNVAGYKPILVMDVWEHAFLLDYKPADRPKYIEAFFSNINWGVLDSRVSR